MATVFLTGFPGFLGSELVRRLLARYAADVTITCLIQSKFRAEAERRVIEIEAAQPDWNGRIELLDGDITHADLGLSAAYHQHLQDATLEIFHLAAVYALGVTRELAMRVNVDGTRHVLRFAAQCANLRRFHYISTCYVSGRHVGFFTEADLRNGQAFNNYYEETKYWAELEVQQAMAKGLPVTIYRPSIVVGDSQTGETQKYDGPYYAFQWILRQGKTAVLPDFGNADQYEVNVVPRDFVVNALDYLSAQETSRGQVYHLSDPQPLTVKGSLDVVAEAMDTRIVAVRLPGGVVKGSLRYVPGLYQFVRMEPAMVDYFTQPTRYTCENTLRDLAGSGITCPPFSDYVGTLIDFMRQNPHISPDAMV